MNPPDMIKLSDDERLERYLKAEDAIRDILYMYLTCINYNCLFDDFGTENGNFDPLLYIDCSVDDVGYDLDYKLLHEGSAIKIACNILQSWGQGGYPKSISGDINRSIELVKSNRMLHIPELHEFITIALESYSEANNKGNEIYMKYVVGYFAKLIANNT